MIIGLSAFTAKMYAPRCGGTLAIPRLFAALFLFSVTGIIICLLLDAVLRHWYEGAGEAVQE